MYQLSKKKPGIIVQDNGRVTPKVSQRLLGLPLPAQVQSAWLPPPEFHRTDCLEELQEWYHNMEESQVLAENCSWSRASVESSTRVIPLSHGGYLLPPLGLKAKHQAKKNYFQILRSNGIYLIRFLTYLVCVIFSFLFLPFEMGWFHKYTAREEFASA